VRAGSGLGFGLRLEVRIRGRGRGRGRKHRTAFASSSNATPTIDTRASIIAMYLNLERLGGAAMYWPSIVTLECLENK
jgi:hypothetical protein